MTDGGSLTHAQIFDIEEHNLIWASPLIPRALCAYSFISSQYDLIFDQNAVYLEPSSVTELRSFSQSMDWMLWDILIVVSLLSIVKDISLPQVSSLL